VKYPPQVSETDDFHYSTFPYVGEGEWCGEFKPKKEVE
jgi:hypothetical protein